MGLLEKRLNGSYLSRTKCKVKEIIQRASDEIMDIIYYIPKKIITVICCVISGMLLLFLAIYIPSWVNNDEEGYYSLAVDDTAVQMEKAFNNNDDYDKDGLKNSDELNAGTDIFNNDTDGDGLSDKYEIDHKLNPNKPNKELISIVKNKESGLKSPVKMNDVILWPDNYKSKAYGTVIKTVNGFYFKNFKGWAKLPESKDKFVYMFDDGEYKEMKYKETENAYYVDKDTEVVVKNKEIKPCYKVTFAGYSKTFKSGKLLKWLLPSDHSWFTCKTVYNHDDSVAVLPEVNNNLPDIKERIKKNTNSLNQLASVWKTIDSGKCVYVSFVKKNVGESVGIIYGYTYNGDLLVADNSTGKYAGTIHIKYDVTRIYDGNDIKNNEKFSFEGLGFYSKSGDRINFLGYNDENETINYLS